MSQEELAHRAEIDRTYISSLERCIYGASIDVVDRLATVLGIEAWELLKLPQEGQFSSPPESGDLADLEGASAQKAKRQD